MPSKTSGKKSKQANGKKRVATKKTKKTKKTSASKTSTKQREKASKKATSSALSESTKDFVLQQVKDEISRVLSTIEGSLDQRDCIGDTAVGDRMEILSQLYSRLERKLNALKVPGSKHLNYQKLSEQIRELERSVYQNSEQVKQLMRELKTQERLRQQESNQLKSFGEAKELSDKRHEQLHKKRLHPLLNDLESLPFDPILQEDIIQKEEHQDIQKTKKALIENLLAIEQNIAATDTVVEKVSSVQQQLLHVLQVIPT